MKESLLRAILFCAAVFICYDGYLLFVGGDITEVSIHMDESDVYGEDEIMSAAHSVERAFRRRFHGCTLNELEYKEDYEAETWGDRYYGRSVMVIFSEFVTDEKGVDGSMNRNCVYSDWMWILVKSNLTNRWLVVDYGY